MRQVALCRNKSLNRAFKDQFVLLVQIGLGPRGVLPDLEGHGDRDELPSQAQARPSATSRPEEHECPPGRVRKGQDCRLWVFKTKVGQQFSHQKSPKYDFATSFRNMLLNI